MSVPASIHWDRYESVLFDLDGVLTPTAEVHMRAWSQTFGDVLANLDTDDAPDESEPDTSPYTDADYYASVDGKPRYDGVRDFLSSRGIELPEGDADDLGLSTVRGIGNLKDEKFRQLLIRDGVQPFPGSVALLDVLADLDIPLAVVSSSVNAPSVLEAAGLSDRFRLVVSGAVATKLGLAGKPAPDTFEYAAAQCGATPATSVVIEDAVSGVAAGAAGHFAVVVGVDRGVGPEALRDAGATIVVSDLGELV